MPASAIASATAREVALNDGTTVIYAIRGLTEPEIVSWTRFCASIFAYKVDPPSPAYFHRHYANDPDRDASLIRVACHNETEIVASVRVFRRRVSLAGGGSCLAGGIGEVCTLGAHRRRGLSKMLLQDAMSIMRGVPGMQLSLLHAAPDFFPVYQKSGGYQCTTTRWSTAAVSKIKAVVLPAGDAEGCKLSIRPARFPNDTDQLSKLHRAYSENRFVGCIIRSKAYWNEYLSKELDDCLWVLADCSDCSQGNDDFTIVGWWSFRPRGDRYQLREFGVDRDKIATGTVLANALQHQLTQIGQQKADVAIPTVVLDEAELDGTIDKTGIALSTIQTENDMGWMYAGLEGCPTPIHNALANGAEHLIWPADSF